MAYGQASSRAPHCGRFFLLYEESNLPIGRWFRPQA